MQDVTIKRMNHTQPDRTNNEETAANYQVRAGLHRRFAGQPNPLACRHADIVTNHRIDARQARHTDGRAWALGLATGPGTPRPGTTRQSLEPAIESARGEAKHRRSRQAEMGAVHLRLDVEARSGIGPELIGVLSYCCQVSSICLPVLASRKFHSMHGFRGSVGSLGFLDAGQLCQLNP